jgi:DNA invertase Pin-like site-specific DNA recombinase
MARIFAETSPCTGSAPTGPLAPAVRPPLGPRRRCAGSRSHHNEHRSEPGPAGRLRRRTAHTYRMAITNDSAGHNGDENATLSESGTTSRQNSSASTPVSAGQLLGYARVSTGDQDATRQHDALIEARCTRIFEDTASGMRSTTDRPGMVALMDHARAGDKIVMVELSRAGRKTSDLLAWVEELDERGIGLVVLNLGIDTATPGGRLVLTIMAALAAMERALLVERTRDGLAAARRRGRIGGRPRTLTDEQVALARSLLARGTSAAETARLLGGVCSERTIRRVCSPNSC